MSRYLLRLGSVSLLSMLSAKAWVSILSMLSAKAWVSQYIIMLSAKAHIFFRESSSP